MDRVEQIYDEQSRTNSLPATIPNFSSKKVLMLQIEFHPQHHHDKLHEEIQHCTFKPNMRNSTTTFQQVHQKPDRNVAATPNGYEEVTERMRKGERKCQ
jgi:hypothetical protein